MAIATSSISQIENWLRNYHLYLQSASVMRGEVGWEVKIIQEWLCLEGSLIKIDAEFGPVTEQAVRAFQEKKQLRPNGIVDRHTFDLLYEPMKQALLPIEKNDHTLNDMVTRVAKQHLAQKPFEVGGPNAGSWVRLYMMGNEGARWFWCAGFVSFILKQASDALGRPSSPLAYTFSCALLSEDAKKRALLTKPVPEMLHPGDIFLLHPSQNVWEHTGILLNKSEESFSTIEGNTDSHYSSNGIQVAQRVRHYNSMDFISLKSFDK